MRSGDGAHPIPARSTTLKPLHFKHASDPLAAPARGQKLPPCTGSAEPAVEVLLQRIGDGVLAEDRQEALADLRDWMSNNAPVCDTRGFPASFFFE